MVHLQKQNAERSRALLACQRAIGQAMAAGGQGTQQLPIIMALFPQDVIGTVLQDTLQRHIWDRRYDARCRAWAVRRDYPQGCEDHGYNPAELDPLPASVAQFVEAWLSAIQERAN